MEWIHRELRRKGVTLQLLWAEYKQMHPTEGYQYSQFCQRYYQWRQRLNLVMRQNHRAGEKLFIDYAGQTVPVTDPATGEVRQAQIFVAVLGASNYSYAEAMWTQELGPWIGAHCRALEFLGGVPAILVPDNLKAGVYRASRYEPEINATYQEMAAHYGTVVIPARPRKARDKAKVEAGVLLIERWILAALRNRQFFSLAELNEAIAELLVVLNDKPFQKLEGSRRSLFETVDKPALKPLPPQRYEFAEWKKARVNIDYHVEVRQHDIRTYYSVPYQLVHQQLDVRLTATIAEIFHSGKRVASHPRVYRNGQYVTGPRHMPAAHRKHAEWTPSRIIRWAETTGPNTAALVQAILETKLHPEQGYRPCLGLLRLGQRYTPERLEAACTRALHLGAIAYRSVKSILERGLDRLPLMPPDDVPPPLSHSNVRGPEYYSDKGVPS